MTKISKGILNPPIGEHDTLDVSAHHRPVLQTGMDALVTSVGRLSPGRAAKPHTYVGRVVRVIHDHEKNTWDEGNQAAVRAHAAGDKANMVAGDDEDRIAPAEPEQQRANVNLAGDIIGYYVNIANEDPMKPDILGVYDSSEWQKHSLSEAINTRTLFRVIPGISDTTTAAIGDDVMVGYRNPGASGQQRGPYYIGLMLSNGLEAPEPRRIEGKQVVQKEPKPKKVRFNTSAKNKAIEAADAVIEVSLSCTGQLQKRGKAPVYLSGRPTRANPHEYGDYTKRKKAMTKTLDKDMPYKHEWFNMPSKLPFMVHPKAAPAFALVRHALSDFPEVVKYFAESVAGSTGKSEYASHGGDNPRYISTYRTTCALGSNGSIKRDLGANNPGKYKCTKKGTGWICQKKSKGKWVAANGNSYDKLFPDECRTLSPHAFGTAIDINPPFNDVPPILASGKKGGNKHYIEVPDGTDLPADLVAVFKYYGFRWGGEWDYFDPMHFDFVGDPAEALKVWNRCKAKIKSGEEPDHYKDQWDDVPLTEHFAGKGQEGETAELTRDRHGDAPDITLRSKTGKIDWEAINEAKAPQAEPEPVEQPPTPEIINKLASLHGLPVGAPAGGDNKDP